MTRPAEGFRAAILTVGLFATPTLASAQLKESPITPAFWSFPSQKTKLQRMSLLPVATISKFGLPMAILSAFNYKKPSGVVSSDRSLKSADACLVATSRPKHVW
jgi:hypothetical protein